MVNKGATVGSVIKQNKIKKQRNAWFATQLRQNLIFKKW
jgi:hypothetical protein